MINDIFYKKTFTCLIRDKENILYDGQVRAISTKNEQGTLDVLPDHTHFISIIEGKISVVKPDDKKVEMPIQKGILKVLDNEVRIYLGIYSPSSRSEQ